MPFRMLISLSVALLTFSAGALGLGNGMVVVVHADGHIGIEKAHVRHAHEHADGSDHEPNGHQGDAEHAALHLAIAADGDGCPVRDGCDQSTQAVRRALEFPVLCVPDKPNLFIRGLAGMADVNEQGITARLRNDRLRSIILTV